MARLLLLFSLLIPTIACSQYSTDQIQGIWRMDENIRYPEESWKYWGNEYYVFSGNKYLFVDVLSDSYDTLSIYVCYFGFSNEYGGVVSDSGEYFNSSDDSITYHSTAINLVKGEYLYLYYGECSYIERLPKVAHLSLLKRSLYDHRNYAREFLDYDICGIKTEDCQLLDSLQQPIGIAIPKDEIVVVRNNCGDLLQVEYEPASDKFVSGYLRREDLQFVEIEN